MNARKLAKALRLVADALEEGEVAPKEDEKLPAQVSDLAKERAKKWLKDHGEIE